MCCRAYWPEDGSCKLVTRFCVIQRVQWKIWFDSSKLRYIPNVFAQETLHIVYNWQFIHSIGLWTRVLSALYPNHTLQPLIYPLIQVALGSIEWVSWLLSVITTRCVKSSWLSSLSTNWLGQRPAKEPLSLIRVKLPNAHMSSEAAKCPHVYYRRWRLLHTVLLIAEHLAGKLLMPVFIVFGLIPPGLQPESPASVADALSTWPLTKGQGCSNQPSSHFLFASPGKKKSLIL